MDGFASEYLANLTADLTVRVLDATRRGIREALSGTEGERALRRCIQAGLVALLAKAAVDAPDDAVLLRDIFSDFFEDRLVALEISKLLRGRSLDRDELADAGALWWVNPPGWRYASTARSGRTMDDLC